MAITASAALTIAREVPEWRPKGLAIGDVCVVSRAVWRQSADAERSEACDYLTHTREGGRDGDDSNTHLDRS